MTYDMWKTTNPADYLCEMCGADARYQRRKYCSEPECPHGLYVDPDQAYEEWRDRIYDKTFPGASNP